MNEYTISQVEFEECLKWEWDKYIRQLEAGPYGQLYQEASDE